MAVNHLPSPELLRQLLDYDPETGALTWRPRPVDLFPNERAAKGWNTQFAGRAALTAGNGSGYRHGSIFDQKVFAHRAIWALMTGAWPEASIDHANGNRSDNRWINLRSATRNENAQNKRPTAGATSRFLGVCWSTKERRWIAQIHAEGKNRRVGCYTDEVQAARAYDGAATVHFGPFANLNFPSERAP